MSTEYSARQAAQILKTSKRAVIQQIEKGRLSARMVDGRYIITSEAIAEYQQIKRTPGRPKGK